MKRAGKWLLNGITILSIVLFVATIAMWARSTVRYDWLRHISAIASAEHFKMWRLDVESNYEGTWHTGFEIHIDHCRVDGRGSFNDLISLLGFLDIGDIRDWPTTPQEMDRLLSQINGANHWIVWPAAPAVARPGYHYRPLIEYQFQPSNSQNITEQHLRVYISNWLPATLFLLVPGLRLIMFIRKRRQISPGICKKCGYDLRASPIHCPECGTPVPHLNV